MFGDLFAPSLADMGAENVNESTIIENYKMAINVLSRVKV